MDFYQTDLSQLHADLVNKKISATELTKETFDHIEGNDDQVKAFLTMNKEAALQKAAEVDAAGIQADQLTAGVPLAVKDNILTKGLRTTAASKMLENFNPVYDATVIEKLNANNFINVGKTNLDEFAMGSSTENSSFFTTHNPWDLTRVPGGSSGGSAVAVALDIVEFATGTDTGGSIRQPASFNGIYGLKPTYGTISRYGVVAMASSTDCIGFFTKNAEDMDLLMSICAGRDEKDLTSLPSYYNNESQKYFVPKIDPKTAKIGIIKDFRNDSIDPEVQRVLDETVEKLKSAGHEVVELSMPALKYALAVYYIVVPAEVASNLSRYDGIRYGCRSDRAKNLGEVFGLSRNEGFMPENKRRIMIGNFVLSSGFYDAYFKKAEQARTLIIQEYQKAFEKCDFLLTPVSPSPAFKLGEKVSDPVAMYFEDVMSVPINLAGLPSLAVPAGEAKDSKLPIGLQIIGPRRSDKSILSFAKILKEEAN